MKIKPTSWTGKRSKHVRSAQITLPACRRGTHQHFQSESSCRRRFVFQRCQGSTLLLLMEDGTSCSWFTWGSTCLVHLHTPRCTVTHQHCSSCSETRFRIARLKKIPLDVTTDKIFAATSEDFLALHELTHHSFFSLISSPEPESEFLYC